jgi:hypothetical protein
MFVSFYRFWSGTAPSMDRTLRSSKTNYNPPLQIFFSPPLSRPNAPLYACHMKRKVSPQQAALIHAVSRAGGQTALARELGIKPQAVQRWCSTGRLPPLRVLAVEAASGVSRKALRPDIYP